MELTREILENLGFETSHPDYKLAKYKQSGENWFACAEEAYVPTTNNIMFNVNAWRENEKGVIIKRAQVGFINTEEELLTILDFVGIELNKDK